MTAATPEPAPEPTVHLVQLPLCDPCIDGQGDECHTPGCTFFLFAPPERSIRDFTADAAQDARPAPGPAELQFLLDNERAERLHRAGERDEARSDLRRMHRLALDVLATLPDGSAKARRWREQADAIIGRHSQPQTAPGTVKLDAAVLHREVHRLSGALEAIIREVDALDEPGPAADSIRMLALHGLGEGPHPDGDGIAIDVAPPPGVTVNGIPLEDL